MTQEILNRIKTEAGTYAYEPASDYSPEHIDEEIFKHYSDGAKRGYELAMEEMSTKKMYPISRWFDEDMIEFAQICYGLVEMPESRFKKYKADKCLEAIGITSPTPEPGKQYTRDSQPSPEDKPEEEFNPQKQLGIISMAQSMFSPQPSEAEKSKEEKMMQTVFSPKAWNQKTKEEILNETLGGRLNHSLRELVQLSMQEYASQEVRKALQEQTELRWSDEDMYMAWREGGNPDSMLLFPNWINKYKSKTGNKEFKHPISDKPVDTSNKSDPFGSGITDYL